MEDEALPRAGGVDKEKILHILFCDWTILHVDCLGAPDGSLPTLFSPSGASSVTFCLESNLSIVPISRNDLKKFSSAVLDANRLIGWRVVVTQALMCQSSVVDRKKRCVFLRSDALYSEPFVKHMLLHEVAHIINREFDQHDTAFFVTFNRLYVDFAVGKTLE